jgi:hypothetical protein
MQGNTTHPEIWAKVAYRLTYRQYNWQRRGHYPGRDCPQASADSADRDVRWLPPMLLFLDHVRMVVILRS